MAERIERLRHLIPVGTSTTERYTNPRRVPVRFRFSYRSRHTHGTYLRGRLELMRSRAAELGQERLAFGLEADEGICLEFIGETGYHLAVRSLEDARQGIELLGVHQHDNTMSATVYVPSGKVESLIQKVEEYLDHNTKTGNPKNQKLVEGISHIRLAILEAFWLDVPSLMPLSGVTVWWEVWLRVETTPDPGALDAHNDILTSFRAHATRVGLTLGDARRILRFPERLVLLVRGTLEQMARSVELLTSIAELRLARVRVEDFLDLRPSDQETWVRDLLEHTLPPPLNAPAVGLLDTGVLRTHTLLDLGLHADDCTYHPDWGATDHAGHGTAMAGITLYGDLAETLASSDDVVLSHRLESVKILPPEGYPPHDPLLYGAVTQEAIARAEIPSYKRRCTFTDRHLANL